MLLVFALKTVYIFGTGWGNVIVVTFH